MTMVVGAKHIGGGGSLQLKVSQGGARVQNAKSNPLTTLNKVENKI